MDLRGGLYPQVNWALTFIPPLLTAGLYYNKCSSTINTIFNFSQLSAHCTHAGTMHCNGHAPAKELHAWLASYQYPYACAVPVFEWKSESRPPVPGLGIYKAWGVDCIALHCFTVSMHCPLHRQIKSGYCYVTQCSVRVHGLIPGWGMSPLTPPMIGKPFSGSFEARVRQHPGAQYWNILNCNIHAQHCKCTCMHAHKCKQRKLMETYYQSVKYSMISFELQRNSITSCEWLSATSSFEWWHSSGKGSCSHKSQ